jgi:hypothetical protein
MKEMRGGVVLLGYSNESKKNYALIFFIRRVIITLLASLF